MKQTKLLTCFLFLAGLMLTFFGGFATFFPELYTARHDIDLLGNINLYNEFRGTGGLMMASGLLILLGSFRREFTFTAIIVGTSSYLMFGAARLYSMIVDGIPVTGIVRATVVEIIVGLIFACVLIKYRKQLLPTGLASPRSEEH